MNIIKTTFAHFTKHNASRMGASLAYYAVFAMVPLLLLLINVGIFFFNKSTVENELIGYFSSVAGSYLENYFRYIVANIPNGLGVATLTVNIVIAIGIFSVLRKNINELWDTKEQENRNFVEETKHIVREKFVAFSIVPVLALFMILSISLGIIYSNIKEYLNIYENILGIINVIRLILPILFSILFFAFVYKIFPKIKLPWNEVILGSLVTTTLLFIGNVLIGFYLSVVENISIFSTAGAFAILLAWVYYSSQVFFLGASFTYVYSKSKGYLNKKITSHDSMQY